ncbi:signal peptidase I [Arthrobacter sp. yr096]|uniref:signal peptidase I n=1 Tax=unclassified Arthrobacter TaxID=235627 RepID=UPI00089A7E78|nr:MULTISPECIES: signal peptidase I [unclassified Arthrobacter]SDW39487.1 signal peptidase I [Arthrobacter sp. cf158]SEI58503.1 signal peptidase I [Arthrobacter sp. yr096]
MDTSERQPRKQGWRFVLLALVLAVAISGLVRSLWLDVYYIPSESMEPLLESGDRILVSRTAFARQPIQRGDIVVFDGRGSFAPLSSGQGPFVDAVSAASQWFGLTGSDTTYVKRVIGVPGDHVQCCDAGGFLTVNGQQLEEPYIYPGDEASKQKFDVVVPSGRLWLMGDHRSRSADSRGLLGAPGGGMVPIERVIGRPVQIIWPLDRFAEMPHSTQAESPSKNGQ